MTRESTHGVGNREFPSTFWSDILDVRKDNPDERRTAWEMLAARYWKPIYAYIRVRWAKSREDARDLAQEFFAWMMETGLPGKADPGRGRFRIFVKAALDNYLSDDARKLRRLKRGGDRTFLKLDGWTDDVQGWDVPDPSGKPADQVMEEAWKAELIGRATRILKETYEKEGKPVYYEVFREYYLEGSRDLVHEELAAKHSIALTDVNNYLTNARRLFREILGTLVTETVQGPDELREELRALFGKEER